MSPMLRVLALGRITVSILIPCVAACAMPGQATRSGPEPVATEDAVVATPVASAPDGPSPATKATNAPEAPSIPGEVDARAERSLPPDALPGAIVARNGDPADVRPRAGSGCAGLPEGQCLDFESPAIPPAWVIGKMEFLRVDDVHAHSGTHALHITLPKGDGPQYGYTINTSKAVPKNDGVLFTRMYFFAPAPVGGHVMLMQAAGADGSQYQFNVLGKKFITLVYKNAHLGMTSCGSCADKEAATTPIGKWVCLETEFDGKTGTPSKVYVDGALLGLQSNGKESPLVGSFRRVNFGYDLHVGKHDDIDVWIDDVAVSQTRIGCQ